MPNIKMTQDLQILRIKQESVFPIRLTDWDRLKDLINAIPVERRVYKDLFSASAGIFVTGLFSLIAFICIDSSPNWTLVISWTITVSSLILSIVFFCVDTQQKNNLSSSKENVTIEIERLEHMFDSGSW